MHLTPSLFMVIPGHAQEALGMPHKDKGSFSEAWLDWLGQPSVSMSVALGVGSPLPLKPQLHKSFSGFRKNEGLFLINEGRSLIPTFKALPLAKGNPVNEWGGLMTCPWLRGLKGVQGYSHSTTPPLQHTGMLALRR